MTQPPLMGIDASSGKIAIITTIDKKQKKPHARVIKLSTGSNKAHSRGAGEAFRFVAEHIYNVKEDFDLTPVVYLEAPVVGIGGPGATIPQAYIEGAIMAAAHENLCELMLVNNKAWKKRVCGNGNFNKGEVADAMKDIWPELCEVVGKDQDLIDAGAINRYGYYVLDVKNRLRRRDINA